MLTTNYEFCYSQLLSLAENMGVPARNKHVVRKQIKNSLNFLSVLIALQLKVDKLHVGGPSSSEWTPGNLNLKHIKYN